MNSWTTLLFKSEGIEVLSYLWKKCKYVEYSEYAFFLIISSSQMIIS